MPDQRRPPVSPNRFHITSFCPSCGCKLETELERHENICHRRACRVRLLQQKHRNQQARDRQRRQVRTAEVRDQLKRHMPELVDGNSPPLLMVVPSFTSQTAPQTEQRKQAFRDNLSEALAAAEAMLAHPEKAANLLSEHEHRQRDNTSQMIVNACSTCRGYCCQQGQDHAFLKADFLAWRMLNDPQLTRQTIADEYLQRLPSQSLNNSCLYHTPAGCALPRSIRSSTCNDFLCTEIVDHSAALRDHPDQSTVAVAVERDGELRVGIMNHSGQRSESRLAGDD